MVSVLSVPTDEDAWSPRLRVYLNAITKYHARKKETPLGTLMVTNLSGFPSALSVIAVPDGDVRKHRADFIVNENLKRLNCSGRAGLNLSPPIGATQAKFVRLYKTSDRIPIYNAVIELVKLCQVALLLFGKLAPEYADGLLCDVTEQAINDWWTEIGTEFFNVDPSDGILGPTTIAAILGILLGARNRLSACGAPVGKDVFDVTATKRGISSFQKSQKLEKRTRRLDRETLDRLHKVSAKAASGQGWAVPRAVKSTVAELSGKGGDIVMGMVAGREKVGIAEVETLDIDTFIQLVYGERCKWLWHGKPRKNFGTELFSNVENYEDGLVLNNGEHEGYVWESAQRRSSIDDHPRPNLTNSIGAIPTHETPSNLDAIDKDPALRRTVLKSVTDKITDARSGLGRIKDAVGKTGLRGHYHKYSRDGNLISDGESIKETTEDNQVQYSATDQDTWTPRRGSASSNFGEDHSQQLERRENRMMAGNEAAKESSLVVIPNEKLVETDVESLSSLDSESRDLRLEDHRLNPLRLANNSDRKSNGSLQSLKRTEKQNTSNILRKSERTKHFPQISNVSPYLRASRSLSHLPLNVPRSSYGYRWPRHLSFSAVVDVVATGIEISSKEADLDLENNPNNALIMEEGLTSDVRLMGTRLQQLKDQVGLWVEAKVDYVNEYDSQAARDQESLDNMYRQKLQEYHTLRDASDELLAEEKRSLADSIKDIETLSAKLEYELSALNSKVEDVDNGITEFGRQVLQLESRAEMLLEASNDEKGWLWWALSFFT